MEVLSNWWSSTISQDREKEKPTADENEGETTAISTSGDVTKQQQQQGDAAAAAADEKKKEVTGEEGESASVDMVEEESQMEGIVHDLEDVSKKALSAAKEWGGFFYGVAEKATKTVAETAATAATSVKHVVEEHSMLADFNREQTRFCEGKQGRQAGEAVAVPPWVGYNDEEQLKKQILALSQDKRNFLRNPPGGVPFNFDYATSHPVAMATLNDDANLQKMRFELVPKQVSEENFWRNYFYRVSLLKQSSQLTLLAQQTGSEISSKSHEADKKRSEKSGVDADDVATATDSPTTAEFASEDYENGRVSAEEIKSGMKQLGMVGETGEEALPDWERELQQELQEYEVVTGGGAAAAAGGGGGGGGGDPDPRWEEEIDSMLEEEEEEGRQGALAMTSDK